MSIRFYLDEDAMSNAFVRALRSHGVELVTAGEAGIRHAGIVLVEQDALDVGERMRRMVRLSSKLSSEDMENRLEFLNAWGEQT